MPQMVCVCVGAGACEPLVGGISLGKDIILATACKLYCVHTCIHDMWYVMYKYIPCTCPLHVHVHDMNMQATSLMSECVVGAGCVVLAVVQTPY